MKAPYISIMWLAAGIAWGQASDAPIQFEVASVKPAAPPESGRFSSSTRRDQGRFTATNVTLKSLVMQAYVLKDYQLQCPGWMESERYDIVAKVPDSTPKEQVNAMLQNLLLERFKMTVHREQRDLPAYTLTVAKSGPKMKEFVPDPNTPPMNDGAATGRGGMPPMPPRFTPPPKDKDGYPIVSGRGGWSSSSSEGRTKMTAVGITMASLKDMLSRQLGQPVVDKTGLTGKYGFRLEYAADGMMGPPLPMPMQMRAGASSGPVDGLSDASGPTIFRALQDQLGLKLEAGKTPVEIIVVEKADKVPVEN